MIGIKKKIALKALEKQDISSLSEKGNYILSLCLNELDEDGFIPIRHHLPLYDSLKSGQDITNWNLPDQEKSTVKGYLKDLTKYADLVIQAYYNETIDIPEILPLWLVFPTYDAISIGWRMGRGEQYEIVYLKMLENMATEDRTLYIYKYPAPDYIRERSRYDDVKS